MYMDITWIGNFCFSILRLSTPIIFAALAAVICNKAGLLNMAIESMLLCSALGGVLISAVFHSALAGLLGAILIGAMVGFIISYASFIGKADLYLTNIALNLAAAGGTLFVMFLTTGEKSTTAVAIKSMTLPSIHIPVIENIPLLGRIFSGHNILTYAAFFVTFLVYFFIYKTRLGLRVRSVGENPKAAESVGISVTKIRFIAFTMSGALAGIGGAYLSMGYLSAFTRYMAAGRGYIGLAASNISAGSPFGSLAAAIMFGTADAAANSLQMTDAITEFVMMIPYAVTILGLVVLSIIRNQRKKKIVQRAIVKAQNNTDK